MFNQLMSAVSRLQPGDQMKMHFQRAKPTWLEGSQRGQSGGPQRTVGAEQTGSIAPMGTSASAAAQMGSGVGSGSWPGSGLNSGSGMTPPPAPAQQAAMPPTPMSSPDQTAQNQMLIQRMQQMGPGGMDSGYGGY